MYSLLVFIFLFPVAFARVGVVTCNIKTDCPDNYFCLEKICKKCIRCDLLFRKGNFCATDFSDCEDCLEGYEEILTTDFSNAKKPCKPLKTKLKLRKCENDSSCLEDNYCNEKFCVKCFNCSLVNKLPPVKKCAKGSDECGPCMIGYHEIAVTTEINYKPCERFALAALEIPESHKISFIGIIPFCFFVALLTAAVILFAFAKCKGKIYFDRIRTKITYRTPIRPSAPPLYSMALPHYIKNLEEDSQVIALRCLREKKQKAKVFQHPHAPYYYSEEEAEQMERASVGNDEGTRPSSCAPPNSTESVRINCSAEIILDDFSELNESVVEASAQQHIENNVEENISSENSAYETMNISHGNENMNQE